MTFNETATALRTGSVTNSTPVDITIISDTDLNLRRQLSLSSATGLFVNEMRSALPDLVPQSHSLQPGN